jgi:AcrR family transcriptional regulator
VRGRPPAATKEELLHAVRGHFLAGRRIDIQAICAQLGLSRATVHRWYGSRDDVIGTAMATLVVPLFERIDREVGGAGAARLVDVFERQLRALAEDPALRRFLEYEREAAQRILTASDGLVEPRVVALLQATIEAEMERGYEPPAEAALIAYAIVRMGESFLYADAASGFRGDFDRLRPVYAALLGASQPPAGAQRGQFETQVRIVLKASSAPRRSDWPGWSSWSSWSSWSGGRATSFIRSSGRAWRSCCGWRCWCCCSPGCCPAWSRSRAGRPAGDMRPRHRGRISTTAIEEAAQIALRRRRLQR